MRLFPIYIYKKPLHGGSITGGCSGHSGRMLRREDVVVERQLVPVGWGMMSRTPASQAPARASTLTVGIAAVPGLGCTWFWWLRDTDKRLPEPGLRPADSQLPSGAERGPRCCGDPACIGHDLQCGSLGKAGGSRGCPGYALPPGWGLHVC